MGVSGSAPDVTREDVRSVFRQLDQPSMPLTATEVAGELECTRQTAKQNLEELTERDELQTKKLNNTTQVWWRSEASTDQQTDLAEFRSFVSTVKDYAIFMLNPDGTVTSWNEGAKRIKGYEEDEIVGKHFSTFYTDEAIADEVPEQNLETAVAEGRVEDEGWRVRGDGTRFWANVTITAVRDGDGTLQGFTKVTRDMTERREYEQQLRRKSEQTKKLLQTAPVGIAVQNADRETVIANQRAQEAFGLSEEEFTDNPIDNGEWEIYDANGDPLDPAETPSGRVIATGEPVFDEELIFEPPNGDQMYFRVNTAPLFGPDGEVDRVITGGKDITELKEREWQLEQRKTELETELSEIFGRISDAFYALDDEWRFTHLNKRTVKPLQQSKEELLGQKLWDVIPETSAEIYREKYQRAMERQEPVSFEVYEEDFDAWFEYNLYPSDTGLSVYFRDITERKEYQRKLEESNERLEQFAYAASHDLQEPLRMVTSYLQLLESRYADDLDEDAREFIEFAVDGADRMSEMIDGLLEYSRVETQGDPFEPVDLDKVIENTTENLQVRIEESNAEVTVESLPQVHGDESQLQQVFQNLLSNAIEYSGDDPPQVQIAAERNVSKWVISVTDEGIGIDPDDTDRIFQVFERLHSHEEHPGTGIGLALCQRIIERHDGEIWVNSEPGEGTTFSFTLSAT